MYRRGWRVGGDGSMEMEVAPFCVGGRVVFGVLCCIGKLLLRVGVQDCWKWYLDSYSGYPVNGAYHLLIHTVSLTVVAHDDVI
jgi:hypothetical protein